MSKLSASLFALVLVLSALVLPIGEVEAETLGTNTIYVPVTSNGSPVSTGVTVTLTNVHTGEVLPATYSSAMKLYVVSEAPSGYYVVDVIATEHYDNKSATEFAFLATASKTVSPAVKLEEFPSKQWEWNITVKARSTGLTLTGAQVSFYDKANDKVVASGTTNAQGYAVVPMWDTGVSTNYVLAVNSNLYEMNVTDPVTVNGDNSLLVNLTKSVRVHGFMTDSEGPASNVVAYLLSMDEDLPWIKRLLKSEEGTFFTFDAYPGDFILCVDADGSKAIMKSLNGLTAGSTYDESAQFEDQTQREDSTTVIYDADYNSFTLTESTIWSFDDAYAGLQYSDVGSLRMQIDLNAGMLGGVVDGIVSTLEANTFESLVYNHGVKYPTTGGFLVVNDTHYYEASGSLSAFDLNVEEGSVINETGIPYSYSSEYSTPVGEEIDTGANDYTAMLYATYETQSANFTYTVTLPEGYELVDNSSDDPGSRVRVAGFETFTVDSEEYIGGPEPVYLAFEVSEKPSAGAGMEIQQGLVYAITDDGGNVTKYIVRVGSEVNFSAMDSFDPNGNPMTYTWDFDDFTAPSTTSNVTMGHTFGNASASRMVNLTVTDAVGKQNWTEIEVLCDDADPVPVISIKDRVVNETSGMLELNQGETVWLNATYSTDDAVSADDSLGAIDFFEFYYGEGNESERISWTDDEKNVSHAFADSGTYNVVLNVTDVAGHWKNTTLVVKVNDSDAPVVSFTVKNATYGTSLIENETIVFDANATKDNLDALEDMYFSWNFADGMGAESWLNGTGLVNVTHVFKKVGTFSVELNVTDLSNNSAFIKHSVKIESSARPNVVIDGPITFEPAEFTEDKAGTIIVNLTNKGSAVATDIVVTFYIVDEDGSTLIGTTSTILDDSGVVTELEVEGKARVEFKWTPGSKGTYKIKVNVTSADQLVTDSLTTKADEDLIVKEAPWKKAALWGGIAAVIVLVPLLLYLRGRWSRRERRGPRRDRGRPDRKDRKEKDKQEKRERKEREKERAREAKEAKKSKDSDK